MCGIVGLFCKSPELEPQLGTSPLARCSCRWASAAPTARASPSTAIRRRRAASKLTLYSRRPARRTGTPFACELGAAFGGAPSRRSRAGHARARRRRRRRRGGGVGARAPARPARDERRPRDRDLQGGRPPARRSRSGSRSPTSRARTALGHTRMATESRVTTEGSHPFSTGHDLCLVHNGSLSNHNRLRREPPPRGDRFQTENDTEVAAGYLAWRLREGASLEQALEGCLDDLDGFYTFLVGTADGFAVLRDPIACKPAVLAETDEWVAMASEYRAIAVLPGRRRRADLGARARRRLRVGAESVVTAGRRPAAEVVDLASTPLRELNQRLHDLPPATTGAAPLAGRQPERRARRRVRARRRRRGRDRRARRLLLRRDEQARDGARPRQRGHRARREHDVGPRSSSTATRASRPARPAAAGCSSSTATPPRAAGSR